MLGQYPIDPQDPTGPRVEILRARSPYHAPGYYAETVDERGDAHLLGPYSTGSAALAAARYLR